MLGKGVDNVSTKPDGTAGETLAPRLNWLRVLFTKSALTSN